MRFLNTLNMIKKQLDKLLFLHSNNWELQDMIVTTLINNLNMLLGTVKTIRIQHLLTTNRLLSLHKVLLQVFLITRTFTIRDPINNELNQAKLNDLIQAFAFLFVNPIGKNLN